MKSSPVSAEPSPRESSRTRDAAQGVGRQSTRGRYRGRPVYGPIVADGVRVLVFLLAVGVGSVAAFGVSKLQDGPPPGTEEMRYHVPVDGRMSCDWQCHRDRTPPSLEPGTDYAVAVHTPVAAAESGFVEAIKTSPSGAAGRVVRLKLDDGNTVRYLHLAQVLVEPGQRVVRGEIIALSGTSPGGPHVHVTLLLPGRVLADSTDFEDYTWEYTPAPSPEP